MINNPISTQPQEWGIQDYLNLFFRRLRIIIIVFVVIFASVLVYIFMRPPVYQSSATFMVETRSVQFEALSPQFGKQVKPFGYYVALLESKIFIVKAMEKMKQDSTLRSMGIEDDILNEILQNDLELTNFTDSDLLKLSVNAYEPIVAFRIASIASDIYKLRCQEIEKEEALNVVSFVNRQNQLAQNNLEIAEKELQEFVNKTKINISQQEGGIIKRLGELENQLAEVETQRQLAQVNLEASKLRLKQMKGADYSDFMDIESPQVFSHRQEIEKLNEEKNKLVDNTGSSSLQIAVLDRQIEAKKKELIQAILDISNIKDTNISDEVSLVEIFTKQKIDEEINLYTLQNRERFYRQLIENFRKQHPNLLEHALELARLQRAKTVNENLYNFLLQRGEEAKIRAATGTGGLGIIDIPVIQNKPMSKNLIKNILLGFIAALGIAFGYAWGRDRLDNTICDQKDVQSKLGIPFLGGVPNIKIGNGRIDQINNLRSKARKKVEINAEFGDQDDNVSQYLLSSLKPRDAVVEAYRNIRTNLQFVNPDKPFRTLLITSSSATEGKTTTAANLGIVYSGLGKKVLIIDADLRKPKQHKLFNIEKSPGLTDYLAMNLSIDKVIYSTHVNNLSLMPAGTSPPNPAEMIASQKMTELIDKLKDHFELIIFDSAPILAVTDSMLLATKIENVLLVTKFASTNWHFAQEALSKLGNISVKAIGCILNDIKRIRGYGYYYSYYYKYYDSGEKKRRRKKG